MNHLLRPVYSPALRMKKGELEGVRQLAEAVADCILPRFIVPPQIERDKTGPLLIEAEAEPDISVALGDHWRQRPVLVDTTYIIDEYGRDRLAIWLSAMFERARDRSVKAIPMALLRDLTGVEVDAFRAVIAADERTKFAICVSSEEMVGPEFGRCLGKVLDGLRLSPEDCAVISCILVGVNLAIPRSLLLLLVVHWKTFRISGDGSKSYFKELTTLRQILPKTGV